VAVQGSEYPVEVIYSANLTNWITLRPTYSTSPPGGTGENANVVVLD